MTVAKIRRRVSGLLTHPRPEWDAIAAEDCDPGTVYREYVAGLAAVPALSILIGLAITAGRFLGTAGIMTAVVAAAVSYAMSLAGVAIVALAAGAAAPRFGASGSTRDAVRLVAYASTPAWLAGAFYVSVTLSPLAILGIPVAIYLLYLGAAPVMKSPLDQRVPFTAFCTLAMIVANIVLRTLAGLVRLPYYGL